MEHAASSSSVSITCSLEESAGWLVVRLAIDGQAAETIYAGYSTDAIGDFLRAALVIAASGREAEVKFDGEPKLWWLSLTRQLPGDLLVELCSEDDHGAGRKPPSFAKTCAPDAFARSVLSAAETIWQELGAVQYDRIWDSGIGFPLRAMRALGTALKTPEPVPTPRESDPQRVDFIFGAASESDDAAS